MEFSEELMLLLLLLKSWEATDIKVIVSAQEHLVHSKDTIANGGIDELFPS